MTDSEEIKKKYDSLIKLAEEHDSCINKEVDDDSYSPSIEYSIKEDLNDKYWNLRTNLEEEITYLMRIIRTAFNAVPSGYKEFTEQVHSDRHSDDTYIEKIYKNGNYKNLLKFFGEIQDCIEGRDGTLKSISQNFHIFDDLRELRGTILSFVNTLDILIPTEMISTEYEVEIILKLGELGIDKAVDELEEMIKEDHKGKDKCGYARTALEQVLVFLLENNRLKSQGRFFKNLNLCIKNNLISKTDKKIVGAGYSYISKIIHSELEDSVGNVQYAIKNIYQVIEKLIQDL